MHVAVSRGANEEENAVSIILPAEQVLKAAKQVPPLERKPARLGEPKDQN